MINPDLNEVGLYVCFNVFGFQFFRDNNFFPSETFNVIQYFVVVGNTQ